LNILAYHPYQPTPAPQNQLRMLKFVEIQRSGNMFCLLYYLFIYYLFIYCDIVHVVQIIKIQKCRQSQIT